MTKLPDFTISVGGYQTAVSWHDEKKGARYHFWLRDDHSFDGCIYRNPITRDREGRHQPTIHLDGTSKKWAPIVQAMIYKIGELNMVTMARIAHKAEQEAQARAQRQARVDKLRAAFAGVCPELRQLPDETILKLADAAHIRS